MAVIEIVAMLVLFLNFKDKLARKGRGSRMAFLAPAFWLGGQFAGALIAAVVGGVIMATTGAGDLSTMGMIAYGTSIIGGVAGAILAYRVVRAAAPVVYACPECGKEFTPYMKGGLGRHSCDNCKTRLLVSDGAVTEVARKKPDEGRPDEKTEKPTSKGASASAVARLKTRADRGAKRVRRGARLSDEERQALWHKAVMRKAHKLKVFTDLLIFVLIACVLGAHALTFIGEIRGRPDWEAKRGYEIVMQLVMRGTHPRAPLLVEERGEGPRFTMSVTMPKRRRDFRPECPADPLAYAYLAIPAGAVLLLLLYLLDYLVWMGRPLPLVSLFYGFGSIGYLLATGVFMDDGPWYLLRRYDAAASWYMLLIPLFLLGAISMLRFVVSQRWKRYEFAGLPVPVRAPPVPAAAAPGGEAAQRGEDEQEDKDDEPGDKDEADEEAGGKRDKDPGEEPGEERDKEPDEKPDESPDKSPDDKKDDKKDEKEKDQASEDKTDKESDGDPEGDTPPEEERETPEADEHADGPPDRSADAEQEDASGETDQTDDSGADKPEEPGDADGGEED